MLGASLFKRLELTDIIERGIVERYDDSSCQAMKAAGEAECCEHADCVSTDDDVESGYCYDNGFGGTRTEWDNLGKCSNTEGFQATACCFGETGEATRY